MRSCPPREMRSTAQLSINTKCSKLENVSQRRQVMHLPGIYCVPTEGQTPSGYKTPNKKDRVPVLKEPTVHRGRRVLLR